MAQARRAQPTHPARAGSPARSRLARVVQQFELLFLPGLDAVVAAEAEAVLGTSVRPVPGRNDSVLVDFDGRWNRLLALRTPVAVFAVLTFAVPRPKSLLSGEYFPRIVEVVERVRDLDRDGPPATSFRFEAAGAGSSLARRAPRWGWKSTSAPWRPAPRTSRLPG